MCLDNLIKFKCFSETIDNNTIYVENFIDVNSTELSHLADEFTLTGKKLGEQIIKTAVESVNVDILMLNNSVRVNSDVERVKNKFGFDNGFESGNKGIRILNVTNSRYSKIKINSLIFKPNFTGKFDILIDDGRNPITIEADAVTGVICTVNLQYETSMSSVKIKAVDETLLFSKMIKTDKTCGTCSGHKYNIIEQGFNGAMVVPVNYNFISEAYLICDTSDLVCTAIENKNVKLAIAKLTAIKVGIDYYTKMITSKRLNETTTNILPQDLQLFINRLTDEYKKLLHGDGKTTYGIGKILTDYLKSSNDFCVKCNAMNYINKATF